MDRNRWLIFAGLCIAIIAGLVYFSGKDRVDVSSVDAFQITTDREISDNVYGKKDSKVVVFEYADFQCPGCGAAFPQLQKIKEEYKDKIAFVYRDFPLMDIHPHAFAAAATAEAAGLQGKFWEMHDLLFSTQTSWTSISGEARTERFEDYARQLNLNIDQFKTDIQGKKVSEKINFDRSVGLKIGVNSTPTLYLNGNKLNEEVVTDLLQKNGDKFRSMIDSALKETSTSD